MTEQTESVIRLLKEGKIVGYEYKQLSTTKTIQRWQEHSDRTRVSRPIEYDAFNLSFKFDDKWVFEGDKIKMEAGCIYHGEISFNGLAFTVSDFIFPSLSRIKSITIIGNIYETEVSHEKS